MNINQRSGNDPELDSLLRSTDPLTNSVEEAMSASRKNTARIPSSGFSPVINQRTATASAYEKTPAGEHSPAHGFISPEWTPETIENNRPHRSGKQRATAASHRIKRLTFALAASLALIAGALFLGPWGNSPAPAPPASPIHTGPGSKDAVRSFYESGGLFLTGRIRPTLPGDASNLRATGWVMDVYTIGNSGDIPDSEIARHKRAVFEFDTMVPLDLSGFDSTAIARSFAQHPSGVLAVVLDTGTSNSTIMPLADPYGVLISDPLALATSLADPSDDESLTTLDGYPASAAGHQLSYSDLGQFADFPMKHSFITPPTGTPETLKVTKVRSTVDASASACMAVETATGTKILAFSSGSTASTSVQGPGDSLPVADRPLRVTAAQKTGSMWNGENFVLDAGVGPKPLLEVWPTGETATCGDDTGEIVKFAGIKE